MGLHIQLQFFNYFFNNQLLDKIVEETIRNSLQKNPESSLNLTKTELMRYIGICIATSVVNMPNLKMYWSGVVGTDMIKNAMSQKRFEKIRSYLHFNDNYV